MRMRKLVIAAMLIAATGWSSAADRVQEDTGQIDVGGETRTFLVHTPKGKVAGEKTPLVLALHGGLTNGRSMERLSGLDEVADKNGFMVAYPDGSGRVESMRTWNSGACKGYAKTKGVDDVAFLKALIDFMIEKRDADPKRVYVTGMSNGAMMAYRLAAEAPEKIAAVAAVAGTLDVDPSHIKGPVPVLHFHGTDDQFVPFDGPREGKGAGGPHNSVDYTIGAWVKANGASPRLQEERLPDKRDDGTRVVKYSHATKDDPQNIVLYKIEGGGHTWPGRPRAERLLGTTTLEISASEIMWDFFKAHPRRDDDARAKKASGK